MFIDATVCVHCHTNDPQLLNVPLLGSVTQEGNLLLSLLECLTVERTGILQTADKEFEVGCLHISGIRSLAGNDSSPKDILLLFLLYYVGKN